MVARAAIKLTGNPLAVFDGEHDISEPFDEAEARAGLAEADPAEVARVVDAFRWAGFEVSPAVAFYAWEQYSASLSAHWLWTGAHAPEGIARLAGRFLVVAPT